MSKSIIQIIAKAQRQINVQKSEYNSFGKYKYRNAESILTEVKRVLPENIAIIPFYDLSDDEKRLLMTVVITDGEERFEHKSAVFLDKHKGMSNEQCVGTAYSYAYKYALCAIFAIDNGEDADKLPPKVEKVQAVDDKANRVYSKALNNLKGCNTVSEMIQKKVEMVSKMPEFKAEIAKAYDTAVAELDALNEQNEQAANSHSEDDCPF